MVKVMGMLTLETVPGLNRHCRNALVAALSRMGLPVLDETEAASDVAASCIHVGDDHSTTSDVPRARLVRILRTLARIRRALLLATSTWGQAP